MYMWLFPAAWFTTRSLTWIQEDRDVEDNESQSQREMRFMTSESSLQSLLGPHAISLAIDVCEKPPKACHRLTQCPATPARFKKTITEVDGFICKISSF